MAWEGALVLMQYEGSALLLSLCLESEFAWRMNIKCKVRESGPGKPKTSEGPSVLPSSGHHICLVKIYSSSSDSHDATLPANSPLIHFVSRLAVLPAALPLILIYSTVSGKFRS